MSDEIMGGIAVAIPDEEITKSDVVINESQAQKTDTAVASEQTEVSESEKQVEIEVSEPHISVTYKVVKRTFDFMSSLAVSIVLLIPMAVVAVLIMLKDHGSPFYFQKRVGKGGHDLRIAKFRTMCKGADDLEKMLTPEQFEEYKKEYKISDDPRLIGYKNPGDGSKCFGARLRQLSIDELPQILWNICIKGNMSVVGPRPILREELEKNYTSEQQEMLLSVKPGLTGYWQAYARNNARYEDGKRQQMELYYVNNASLLLDIKILLATVGAVIKKSGAK